MPAPPDSGAPLQGLTGLYGARPHGQTGRDPSNFGGPPDRRHAIPGDSSRARPYGGRVYGGELVADDQIKSTPLPGLVANSTPDRHAAPYPVGLVHDPVVAAAQMRTLHGLDLGGPRTTVTNPSTPADVPAYVVRNPSPNVTNLAAVPGQLKSGSDDVSQGYGQTNGHGFEFGYQQRRTVRTGVPLDRPVHGERPFLGHHGVGENVYTVDSPFGPVQGDTSTGMNLGPTPSGYPTPYEQPDNPTYRPSTDYTGEAGFSSGWMAG